MTKFLERKRPVLSKVVLPAIDIPPTSPKLVVAHVQTTNVLPTPKPKPNLAFCNPILTSFLPKNVDETSNRPLSHKEFIQFMEKEFRNGSQEANLICPSSSLHPT